jgi:hypothetical protein
MSQLMSRPPPNRPAVSAPMAGMTTCEPCALREAGDTARVEEIESIRAQRLLLAYLNDADDAQGQIVTELGGCHDCIGRLAATYLGMAAGSLIHITGSTDAAISKGNGGGTKQPPDNSGLGFGKRRAAKKAAQKAVRRGKK